MAIPERLRRKEIAGGTEISEVDVARHFTRLSQPELLDRPGPLPARLVHDEAQPADQRGDGAPARLRRVPPARARGALAGLARAAVAPRADPVGADGPAARDAPALGGRAGRACRHPHGPQGPREGGQRRARPCSSPTPRTAPIPASAHFAGYKVKELKSNARGTIDLDVLEAAMTDDVAALMMTVPNTLGIFEDRIIDIARIVHAKGGYLYCDGANFNAFVGVAKPGRHGHRRHAHEPAQDLLDAARRRRPGRGAGGGVRGARAVPAAPDRRAPRGRDVLPRLRPAGFDRPAADVPRQLRRARARALVHRGLRQPDRRGRARSPS